MRCLVGMIVIVLAAATLRAGDAKPLFKDFMGINGHTVQFKPELYRPTCRLVRDYHPMDWDFGDDTSRKTNFPWAHNRVHWQSVYGSWQKAGFDVNVSLMFEVVPANKWKDIPADAKQYGHDFAKYFGPSGQNLVSSVEIGNEPGKFDDATYRKMFENMARGIREGDPKLKIATCNLVVGKGDDYSKSHTCFEGLTELVDIVNTHSYCMAEGWPTWKRSYPEDPKTTYLKSIIDVIAWRDQHCKGKPVWLTEFGWDASSKKPDPNGQWAKWINNTEKEQAQYLVRSFLVFAKMPLDRAYIYFFNDNDDPHFHGSSGLTRNFQPKPAYYAVAQMYKLLGDYRYSRTLQEKAGEVYAYELTHGADANKRIWAVWSPTGSDRKAEVTLPLEGLKLVNAEQMALAAGDAPKLEVKNASDAVTVPLSEAPVYLVLEAAK